jgi:hypothetical protein
MLRAWHALLVRLHLRPRVSLEVYSWCRDVDHLLAIARRRPLTWRERRSLYRLRGDDESAVEVDGAFIAKLERLSPADRRVVFRLVDALLALQE